MVHRKDARADGLEAAGAAVVTGDLLEIDTIRAAMEGAAAGVFRLAGPTRPHRRDVNFAQAAKEAGVPVIVNLSQRSARRGSKSHSCRDSYIAEQVFNWSGLGIVHLRPTYFLRVAALSLATALPAEGHFALAAGRGRHPDRSGRPGPRDRGDPDAPDAHVGRTIPLSGPVEMDHEQMAAELSEALGRRILFQDLPIADYCASLETMGSRPTSFSTWAARWKITRTASCLAPTTTSSV